MNPKKSLETIKKPDSSKIKNKYLYWANIISNLTSNFYHGYGAVSIGITFPSMKNSSVKNSPKKFKNFNWNDSQSENYLSFITSGYNLGFFISCLFFAQTRNISPRKRDLFFKFLLFCTTLIISIPNIYCIILARFLQGSSVGILISSATNNTYEGAIKSHRGMVIPMLPVAFGVAFIIASLLSIFDNGGFWFWRVIFLVQGSIALIDFFIQLIYLKDIFPVSFSLKFFGEEKTEKMLDRVYEVDMSKSILDEFKRAISEFLS